jgi:hypothetical protein
MSGRLSSRISVLAAFLALSLFTCGSAAQSVRATGYINQTSYQLNGTLFANYTQSGGGVNRGCGDLAFVLEAALHSSFYAHTFTATLKRDGIAVESLTHTFGPWFAAQDVVATFSTRNFTPGVWTIDWTFQISAAQSGTASITLLPQIPLSSPPTNLYQYCNRNSTLTATAYSSFLCDFSATPPTGFIFQNGYYRNAAPTTNCALGAYDGAHCLVMNKPATGFIFQNRFYKKYDACSRGTNDGAHCLLGSVPGGLFAWQGHYYYPSPGGGQCPYLPGSYYDGAHCLVSATDNGFAWNGNFYINYNTCGTGTNDGANCLLASAPWGTTAFEYQGRFYTTTTMSCASGTYDGAHCFIGKPPVPAIAIAQGNHWYWTPRYCQ